MSEKTANKFEFWGSFKPNRPVISWNPSVTNRASAIPVGGPHSDLFSVVYSIEIKEDFRNCITDQKIRQELDKILSDLDIAHPHSFRTLDKVNEFIEKANDALNSGSVDVSRITNPVDSAESATRYFNGLLSLKLHLQWLLQCFADYPNISVSVR